MLSQNEIIIAAAGGGKTTRIVKSALANEVERSALLTYTQNNVREIEQKLYGLNSAIPPRVEVWSWFSFLLRELARPYQNALHSRRIDGFCWVEGRSDRYAKQTDIARFYFSGGNLIYSDKIARFVCGCDQASNGAVIRRLQQRIDHIYIDEIQDMAAYDIDLIELILRSKIKLTLVGDHRQATFRTNNAARHSAYSGIRIIDKFREWDKAGLATLSYAQKTHRCHQSIAGLADAFFPREPRTISDNCANTGHDGVFSIPARSVPDYVRLYRPQVLRLDSRTHCEGYEAMNFGESKGLTFDRVLIFPHQKGMQWLSSGDFQHVTNSAAKIYVGITRARYSVAFVFDGDVKVAGVSRHE